MFFLSSMVLCVAQTSLKQYASDHDYTYVLIATDYGDMVVKLYNETPLHRDNFTKLVKEGFYDSLLFHRVIKNFMIQGGDPDSRHAKAGALLGNGGLNYTIPAEFKSGLYHKKGALAAARMGDNVNPQKASSSTQFYIVQGEPWSTDRLQILEQRGMLFTPEQKSTYASLGGTPFLDGEYTVFGEVVEGLDVIDKIAAVQTDRNDRPIDNVKMKMTIIE